MDDSLNLMDQNKSPLERAFELCRSGRYQSVSEVKQVVAAEGYPMGQFEGRSLSRQLTEIIRAARDKASPDDPA